MPDLPAVIQLHSVVFAIVTNLHIAAQRSLENIALERSVSMHTWTLGRTIAPQAVQYILPRKLLTRMSESKESY